MPDISMCGGNGCPLREDCYRYCATPNPGRQAYAPFEVYIKVVDGVVECAEFIEYKGEGYE